MTEYVGECMYTRANNLRKCHITFLVIYDYTGFFYDGSVGHVIFDKDLSEGV